MWTDVKKQDRTVKIAKHLLTLLKSNVLRACTHPMVKFWNIIVQVKVSILYYRLKGRLGKLSHFVDIGVEPVIPKHFIIFNFLSFEDIITDPAFVLKI